MLAVFAGCAEHPTTPVTAKPLHAGYLMAGRDCASVKTLSAMPLNFDQKSIIKLGEASSCIVTAAGVNEPAALLNLPVSARTYYVTVRVWRGQQVLVPCLALLDGKRRVLRTLTYKDMKRSGGALTTTFFVNSGKGSPAYLLLYPDPSLIGERHKQLRQGAVMNDYYFFYLWSGTAKKSTVVFTEEGTLGVQAHRYENPAVNAPGN